MKQKFLQKYIVTFSKLFLKLSNTIRPENTQEKGWTKEENS